MKLCMLIDGRKKYERGERLKVKINILFYACFVEITHELLHKRMKSVIVKGHEHMDIRSYKLYLNHCFVF
jgi:hypothetical protein